MPPWKRAAGVAIEIRKVSFAYTSKDRDIKVGIANLKWVKRPYDLIDSVTERILSLGKFY